MTLRQFCEKNGFDPGNISKLERDILPPPHSEEKLNAYARALNIHAGDDEYLDFFDLAAASSTNFPLKEISDQQLINKLPVLFRTLDNKELTMEKLNRIINLVEKEVKK
jgi:transcriptional regulator with XRE-family HTH domain